MKEDILILKALSDESRIKIIDALLKKEQYVEALSEMLDLKPPTVSHHLKKLVQAGIVTSRKDQYYTLFSVNKKVLNRSLLSFVNTEADEVESQKQKLEAYEKKILSNFIKYGKLVTIPVQLKKRIIILRKLVEEFEHGQLYEEKEVNDILSKYHEDYCTLRREMIVNKLLQRENNRYWRVI